MKFFKRKPKSSQENELFDIPIGSMVELSDIVTFALEEKTSQTYEMVEYKKYEADGFLRYMYHIISNDDDAILGVDVDPNLNRISLARFVIDSEEEFVEPLGDRIIMEFDDPDNKGKVIPVEYVRKNIINTKMTIVTSEDSEEHEDVELQDFIAEDGSILMVELWDSMFTFFLGESIDRENVNIYPMKPGEK